MFCFTWYDYCFIWYDNFIICVYIIYNINNRWLFIYFIYCNLHSYFSVIKFETNFFYYCRISNIMYIQFFKKKFNCFFLRIDAVYVYIFYIRMIYVQMSPQIFCRDNNWFYVCASTSMQHYIYKIYETFSLPFRMLLASEVKKTLGFFFSKFQENWSFRDSVPSERKFDDCEECL